MNKRQQSRLHTKGRRQRNLRNYTYNPSKPGEFPHLDTGDLRRSIVYEVEKLDASVGTVSVGSNLKYAKHLEYGTRKMKRRLFLRETLRREQRALKKIMESKPI